MSEKSEIPQEEPYKPVPDIFEYSEADKNREQMLDSHARKRIEMETESDREILEEQYPETFAMVSKTFKEEKRINKALRILWNIHRESIPEGGMTQRPEHWIGTLTSDRGKEILKSFIDEQKQEPR